MSGNQPPPLPTPAPETTTLVPPYPGFGPEPLDEPALVGHAISTAAIVVAVGVAAWLARRQLGRLAGKKSGAQSQPGDDLPPEHLRSRRERVIACSGRLRTALVARFGDAWRAKTTEEVAIALTTSNGIDQELAAGLVRFLLLADLAKFGGDQFDSGLQEASAQRGATDLEPWCATLVAGLAAGARSRISGK